MAASKILGVLGGMGPAATADFMKKLIELTPAATDQEHLPTIVVNDPTIPDRTLAFATGNRADVLDAMARSVRRLEAAGADAYAIPCNSAHHWAEDLQQRTRLPVIHIANASIKELLSRPRSGDRVVVMATPVTLASDFYRRKIDAAGFNYLETPNAVTDTQVLPGIRKVKAGDIAGAARLLNDAVDALYACGADAIMLACTELPIALAQRLARDKRLIDTTYALAKACADWRRSDATKAQGNQRSRTESIACSQD